ncbi:hypothetical protein [Pedobacter sp. NJ-S-72]
MEEINASNGVRINTGREIVKTLLKVRSDIKDANNPLYREPLDVNGTYKVIRITAGL